MTTLLTKLDELETLAKAAISTSQASHSPLDSNEEIAVDQVRFIHAADPETILDLCQTLRDAVEVIEFYAHHQTSVHSNDDVIFSNGVRYLDRGDKAREFLEKE